MKTNILTLCDFAKVYNGQLNISGTFNQIRSAVFPSEPVTFYIAMQFVLKERIEGRHEVSISIVNKHTRTALIEPQDLRLEVANENGNRPDMDFTTNLILAIDKVAFAAPGAFTVKVISDGNVQELDFYVVKVD